MHHSWWYPWCLNHQLLVPEFENFECQIPSIWVVMYNLLHTTDNNFLFTSSILLYIDFLRSDLFMYYNPLCIFFLNVSWSVKWYILLISTNHLYNFVNSVFIVSIIYVHTNPWRFFNSSRIRFYSNLFIEPFIQITMFKVRLLIPEVRCTGQL